MDLKHCPNCFSFSPSTPCTHCGWQAPQDNPPPALALGRVLDGRYRIGRVLGHGGFGITYLAWDDNLQLRLAIKEYLPRDCATRAPDGTSLAIYSGPAGEQFAYGLDRFLEEARALAHFDQHPGIVTVKNFFRAHGTGYCVMDYVDGITLRDYLEQQPGGRISFDAALKLLMPVMDALRAVHKEGLLHRDIAPDNIYLTQDGRIKLLDFGAARFAAGEHSKSLSIILKPGYAPEEQYRSKGKQGPWTDIYGLAATFYRAITGSAPPEALDRTEEDELLPPSQQGIAIQPHQEAVLLKALAIKAPLRYQSISEFQQAWRTAAKPLSGPLADAGVTESSAVPMTQASGSAKKAKSILILALAGVVSLLSVAGAFLWSEKFEPPPPMVVDHQPKPAQTDSVLDVPNVTPPAPEITLVPVATEAPTSPITNAAPALPAAPLAQAALDSATSHPTEQNSIATAEDTVPPVPEVSATAKEPVTADKSGEPASPQTPSKPGEKSPIYFAAEVAPTANAPSEAPLCYKFMVAGPEEQLRKLQTKYPNLYDEKILANEDGSKTLQAKRQDETGKVITYFYSTSPSVCNSYQKNRLESQQPSGIAEETKTENQPESTQSESKLPPKPQVSKSGPQYQVVGEVEHQILIASVDGLEYQIPLKGDLHRIEHVGDFTLNGGNEALLFDMPGGGGNCCPSAYFFVVYKGGGNFHVTDVFANSWHEPRIEPWRGKYSLVVEENNEGANNSLPENITKRFVLDTTGEVKLVESHSKQYVRALIEMTSGQFSITNEIGELHFDIDGDGSKECLRCGYWPRWDLIVDCTLYSASGKVIQKMPDNEFKCNRIGFLGHKTKGVHDLVCDFDTVLVWQDGKYIFK